jgi:hypothetical protein
MERGEFLDPYPGVCTTDMYLRYSSRSMPEYLALERSRPQPNRFYGWTVCLKPGKSLEVFGNRHFSSDKRQDVYKFFYKRSDRLLANDNTKAVITQVKAVSEFV